MKKSTDATNKIEAIFTLAQKIFGDLLVEIGIGGSLMSDIDAVAVLRKIDLEAVKQFREEGEKQFGQRISCRVLTPLMIRTNLLDGKVATMLLKGMAFWRGGDCFSHLKEETLMGVVRQNLGDEISGILRAVLEKKYNKDKAIDLLIQLLAICQ